MKKIGMVTYPQIEDGKGRFLQAYALYAAIEKLGYEPTIINYKSESFNYKPSIKRMMINIMKKPSEIVSYLSILKKRIRDKNCKINSEISKKKYLTFISDNIRTTVPVNRDFMYSNEINFDAYVCGSDQIWNTNFTCGIDPVYYLDFAKKGKKIAYAPSMGTLDNSKEKVDSIIEMIKAIDCCSMREKSSVEMVNSMYDTKIEYVFDPTFLMDRKWWDNFANVKPYNFEYVLVFTFDENKAPLRWAQEYAQKENLKVLMINDSKKRKSGVINVGGIGPNEFVSLFKNARCIFTQSFHGTVLSLLYNKEFYVFDRKNHGDVKGLILRIKDLLSDLNLENRIVYNDKNYDFSPISYEEANKIIDKKRNEGLSFLGNSLLSCTER